ncbi:MAG: hypothetical protein R3F61_05750 [Myxococcota bacterium]
MGKRLVTVGSISREDAAERLPFLASSYPGRRTALRDITHADPDLVFWISPDGRFIDARDGHLRNPPKGHEHILRDQPDYGGFLRGRIAWYGEQQFVVVYVRPDALVAGPAVHQLVAGLGGFPVPVDADALVISDNGDLYGTVDDVISRSDDDHDPSPEAAAAWGTP